jgi:hypothetical protein
VIAMIQADTTRKQLEVGYLSDPPFNIQHAIYDMGGITLNVANIGAMVDLIGTVIGRSPGEFSELAKNLIVSGKDRNVGPSEYLNIGVLQVNLARDGVTASIGTGGIDVGGSLYDAAKRGLDYANMMGYAKGDTEYAKKLRETVLWNYILGDVTQENTSARIASGVDTLILEDELKNRNEDDILGITRQKEGNGNGRIIQLEDHENINNVIVALGHESYRDGVVRDDNYLETRKAVLGHTEMALRMMDDGYKLDTSGYLGLDLAIYEPAKSVGDMSIMAAYADAFYGSDGDYLEPLFSNKPGMPKIGNINTGNGIADIVLASLAGIVNLGATIIDYPSDLLKATDTAVTMLDDAISDEYSLTGYGLKEDLYVFSLFTGMNAGQIVTALEHMGNMSYVMQNNLDKVVNNDLIRYQKYWDELAKNPGTLSERNVRAWYLSQEDIIPNLLDKRLPLEQQARQAHEFRNIIRTYARDLMADRQKAAELARTSPNMTWEQTVNKYSSREFTGDALWNEIIKGSQRSRSSVNERLRFK